MDATALYHNLILRFSSLDRELSKEEKLLYDQLLRTVRAVAQLTEENYRAAIRKEFE